MKVLEVLDCYYPKFDGPTLVITSYCKSFLKMDDIIGTAVVPHFPDYVDDQPFTVFRVKSLKGPEGYYYGTPAFDNKLKAFLKNEKIDLIHIHSPFTMCSFFAKYGKSHNIPTVFTFHTKYDEDFERMMKMKMMQKIALNYIVDNINRADYVLTVSYGAAECLRGYGYNKPIKVIRNGTDLTYPTNADELKEEINSKYGLAPDELVFLSVGRLVENKKIGFALNVMGELKKRGLKFKYIIVGDGVYFDALKQEIAKLNLSDCVIMAGRVMDRRLLSAHYLRANLFVFPSTFDTASLAPIEAAAMKLPTIMTRGCSTAEIIAENVNGLLAEENVAAWADAISSAIENNTLEPMRERAYKEVYRTWDSVAAEVGEFYKKVVAEYKVKK